MNIVGSLQNVPIFANGLSIDEQVQCSDIYIIQCKYLTMSNTNIRVT